MEGEYVAACSHRGRLQRGVDLPYDRRVPRRVYFILPASFDVALASATFLADLRKIRVSVTYLGQVAGEVTTELPCDLAQ